MATINDLPRVEGISEFFCGEIYGEVGDLLIEKGVFGNEDDRLYAESVDILLTAKALPDIILSERIPPEKKDEIIEEKIRSLTKRLAALKAELLGQPQEETGDTT